MIGVACTSGLAQSAPGEFRFEHLTVNDGLSHSDAMAVVQDRAGFIWVGTNRGINRYDGYGLKKYILPVNSSNGLSGNRVRAFHVGPNGRLWVGAESSGLSYYDADHDRFLNIKEQYAPPAYRSLARQLAESDVVGITSDVHERLWVGTQHDGLFVLSFTAQGKLASLRQVRLTENGSTNYQVLSLVATPEGQIWVGTLGSGLRIVDAGASLPESLATRAVPLAVATVRAVHLDRRGDLWIGTTHQVFWVSRRSRLHVRDLASHPLPQACRDIHDLRLDSFGRLWVGTDYGLYLWQAAAVTGIAPPLQPTKPTLFLPVGGDPFSLQSERVHQLFEDQNQVLWLAASAGGLNRVDLRQKPFGQLQHQLTSEPTLPNNYVNAIYKEEAKNLLWIGTRNGFSRYDLARKTYHNYLSWQQSGDGTGVDVSSIVQASDGTLWLGTRTHGLYTLKREGEHEVLARFAALSTQPDKVATSIESIVEDRYATMWVATFNAGLARFSRAGKHLKTYRRATGLPTDHFTCLLYDRKKDVLWASTRDAGLLKLRVTADSLVLLKRFTYDKHNVNSLSVNYTWPLLQDKQGTLWIGTIGGGLHQLQTDLQGRETIRRCNQWMPESDVESILADEDGHLWIGGTGLYRVTPTTHRYLLYDVEDGLQSNSFKIGAACRAQDSTLYFGGINGISYFKPRAIQTNPYPPVVRITGLRIANKSVAVGELINKRVLLTKDLARPQTIAIRADENDFSVEFVGLNYATPNKHHYAYQLVGYNTDWVAAAPGQRTAGFANLQPGNYTFLVKASNGDGLWSKEPATLQFTILPPWWKTWWAYLLYSLALSGALLLYRRVTMAQQGLKSKLTLEKFRVEKEKELTDLKLSFFTNVSHELRTPLTLILGPMEELLTAANRFAGLKDNILLMHKQTRKLLELVNQLLDFRKVEAGQVPLRATRGDIIGFVTEIFLIFKLKAEERDLAYSLLAPPEPVELYFDPGKLEIVLTNLLSNAFKYTREHGTITLTAAVVGDPESAATFGAHGLIDNYLELKVIDQGIGMKPSDLANIFDAYYQASQTETLRMMGTGIGLSLVKQFVERHAGEITVESAVGQGTTFTVRLPFGREHLAPADLAPTEASAEPTFQAPETPISLAITEHLPEAAEELAAGTRRLLIVEDNDDVRHYVEQLFRPDYEVMVAIDGAQGWAFAQALLPDLVISDVMMPNGNGLELCQKIKQNPKTLHIPVVLLTARTAAVHELEGLENGADDYVSKPFNPKLLQAKVSAILRNRLKTREFYQRQILLEPTEAVIPEEDKLFLEKAMKVVEDNLSDLDFNVQVLIREMGMSQSFFYRRVKSITGQSVVAFIRDVRLKRAAQLLSSTHLRVSDIAYQVGMQDLKHFRTEFQKIYNMSPSEYAKQHRGSEPVGLVVCN
ncbi:two-component regulator propeller domain-containing protein [Hymenobacter sp. GOD-10R]|uniref:hybrid sensor histidine kinase/response regulator transcription factor n=1 Tax=Hymenobacter sp. GOD-10R TaxID=3093922 RepID=UPI002D766F32|nr:two-component regulator propeller domain-containing protein [Hymenobacter sp. GOD-10R]WRQ28204.1 two-component regulator propeller domain-containing protein [Hymenobacter sp. GOD-10R]